MWNDFTAMFTDAAELIQGYFNNGENRTHWLYWVSSIGLAYFVYVKALKSKDTKSGFWRFFFKRENYLSKTAYTDYGFVVLNTFIKILLISSFAYWGNQLQFDFNEWLLVNYGLPTYDIPIFTLTICYTVAFLILGDFTYYLLHLAYHKLPFLWWFHKVHHSSTAMNPLTQFRIHPVELVLNNLRFILLLVFINGVFDYLTNQYFGPVVFLGVNVTVLAFNAFGANLRHSHIKLTYYAWLEKWLISPYQHQIHHSAQKQFFDKNLGSKLAIWDRIFGTLVTSNEVKELKVGLGDEDKSYDNFLKNLINPFLEPFKKRSK